MNWSANLTTRVLYASETEQKFIICAEWIFTERGCFRRVMSNTFWVSGFRHMNCLLNTARSDFVSAESGLMFQCGKRLRCRLCLNFACGQGWLLCPSVMQRLCIRKRILYETI